MLLLSVAICIVALFCMSCVSSGEAKPKNVTAPAVPPEGVIAINDNTVGTGLNQFEYNPEWNYAPGGGEKYKDDDHYTDKKGACFQVRFIGTNIKVYGTRDAHHGDATVSLDGGEEVTVTYKNANRQFQVLIYDSGPLEPGEHIVKVTVAGKGVVTADRVDITQ